MLLHFLGTHNFERRESCCLAPTRMGCRQRERQYFNYHQHIISFLVVVIVFFFLLLLILILIVILILFCSFPCFFSSSFLSICAEEPRAVESLAFLCAVLCLLDRALPHLSLRERPPHRGTEEQEEEGGGEEEEEEVMPGLGSTPHLCLPSHLFQQRSRQPSFSAFLLSSCLHGLFVILRIRSLDSSFFLSLSFCTLLSVPYEQLVPLFFSPFSPFPARASACLSSAVLSSGSLLPFSPTSAISSRSPLLLLLPHRPLPSVCK